MRDLFGKYGLLAIEIIASIFFLTLLVSIMNHSLLLNSYTLQNIDQTVKGAQVSYDIPVVDADDFIVDNAILEKNAEFDWKDYVRVQTNDSIDIIDYITVKGEVDTSTVGEYTLTFSLNYNGRYLVKEATYYVQE